MSRCCTGILFILNLIALVTSIPIILFARSLYIHTGHTTCAGYLAPYILAAGVFLLVVSILWLIGKLCRMKFILWFHLFVMFLTIIGVLIYSMWGLVAMHKGEVQVKGLVEYRLQDFSPWMQNHVDKVPWLQYKTCLIEFDYCKYMDHRTISKLSPEAYMKLYPTEWGCCQPPRECGYEKKNDTFWEIPKTGLASSKDQDCLTYSNHQDTLCYDCDTCKAGSLATARVGLKMIFIVSICVAIFFMIITCTACHNLKSSKRNSEQHYVGYSNQMA